MASNGAEALDRFKQRHHGVLLMDLHMPVMDGQSAFVAIRETCAAGGWEMPSVVFCSGFVPPDTVREIVSRGSEHCLLAKPVAPEDLVRIVQSRLAV